MRLSFIDDDGNFQLLIYFLMEYILHDWPH